MMRHAWDFVKKLGITPGKYCRAMAEAQQGTDDDGDPQPPSITIFAQSEAETAPMRVYGDTPEQRLANAKAAELLPDLIEYLYFSKHRMGSQDLQKKCDMLIKRLEH